MFTKLYGEEKREERDRGGQRGKGSMKRREPRDFSEEVKAEAKKYRTSVTKQASFVAQLVKNLPAMLETWVRS